MKFKSTILLVVLLVAGVAAVYFLDYKPGEERKVEEFLDKKFITIEADSITEIEIIVQEEKVSLIKSENIWYISDPIRVKANQNLINTLIRTVSKTDKGRKVSDSSNLTTFGLDPSKVSLKFLSKDSLETGYSIGDESPTGEFVFAKRHNDSGIYTVPKELFTQSNKKLYDLREKNILSLKSNEIHKIFVRRKSFNYDINWDAAKLSYIMAVPATLPIETVKMNAFFSRLTNGQAKEFIDIDLPSHSITGLEDGETSIRLWASDPPRQEILLIGNAVTRDGKPYRYARDASRSAIMLIDSSLAEYLERDPFVFIQKELLTFEKDKVDEIMLTYSGTKIHLTKNDSLWNLISTENLIVDESKVNEFLDNLLSLKATAIENYEPENLNNYGISPLIFYLSISENGELVNSIQAGSSVNDESYILSGKSTAIFRVNSASLEKLKIQKEFFQKKDNSELEET